MYNNNNMENWGRGPLQTLQNPVNSTESLDSILSNLAQWGQPQQNNIQVPFNDLSASNPVNQSNGFLSDMSGMEKGQLGLQTGMGLLNGFMALKQYKLAKDQFKFQKDAFNKNYNNQVQTTNTSLRDRQAARVAANPQGNIESVDEYMQNNRVG